MTWKIITLKQYPVFSRYWIAESFRDNMKKNMGFGLRNFLSMYKGIYWDSEEMKIAEKYFINLIEKDPSRIEFFCRNWKKACADLINFTKKLEKLDFRKKSNDELLEILQKVIEKLKNSSSYIFLHHSLDSYFENYLLTILKEKIKDKKKINHIMHIMGYPQKPMESLKAKEDLINIKNKMNLKGMKAVEDDIKKYVEDYKWLGYDTAVGRDLSVDDVKERIINLDGDDKNFFLGKENILDELNLTKKNLRIIKIMQEVIYLSTFRVESNMIAGAHIRPLLVCISERLGCDYSDIVQLSFYEIKDSLIKGELPFSIIKKRKDRFAVVIKGSEIKVYEGDDVDRYEAEKSTHDQKEVSGKIAFPGKAIGRAVIVVTNSDLKKVKKGDIIVTKMTNPHYIIAMEKASAFVTDAGGITSHASIIARELKKPCIMSTGIASEIFKDGDLIEVDANKGVVKKHR